MTAARERGLAAALLAALAVQLAGGVLADGLTNDEPMYIAAGYRHLTAGDYALNTEQPPLAKLAIAVPLSALSLREPPRTGDPWQWAFRFIQHENDPARVITWARVPIVVLTLILAVLVWRWARVAYGPGAGLLALALTTFHPSLLAHGHLATTDVAAALTMTAATWAHWRWARDRQLSRAIVLGALLGIAVATRLTAWLLVPAFLALEAWGLVRAEPAGRGVRLRAVALAALLATLLIPAVVWASYRFRYAPFAAESVAYPPGALLGTIGRVIAFGLRYRLLPEAYLEGARYVAQHNLDGHPTYLLGTVYPAVGPWYYYPVALAVKNTPGFLVATAVGLVALVSRRDLRTNGLAAAALTPAALTFFAASAGRIQIGERYILPIYPFLILIAAGALARLAASTRGRTAVAAILAAHALPVLAQAPRGYLPYFNLLAGGREGGHRVLADSNLDWGQDLPRLARWMRESGVARVQLAYHGPDDPRRFGIPRDDLPGLNFYAIPGAAVPSRGTIAVSPNLLLGIFGGPGDDLYAPLRRRPPDARAGVFFIYRIP